MEKKREEIETQLLLITRQLLLEQETESALRAISLDASLERQLGIDSLGKVELFQRIEKVFGVSLTDSVMGEADTLTSIAEAIRVAKPPKKFFSRVVAPPEATNLTVNLATVETLQDVLVQYALHEPNRPHLYLQNEEGNEEIITYGDLLTKASTIANSLLDRGIKPDDTVSIMLPTGPAFFQAFFGVLLAGAVPVPIYPPFRLDRVEEYALREAKILNNAEARALITFSQAEVLSRIIQSYIPSLKCVTTVDKLLVNKSLFPQIPRTGEQSALLQYTSGSTGDPKGILLQHKNILANLRATGKAIDIRPTDSVISWLPLYHDMGLFSWINSLFFGLPMTILSPLTFLTRPERWLWAIHYHRGTLTAGPNFAYELCVKKITDAAIEGLDLSSLRLACNGAEAVSPQTYRRFYERFKAYGFRKDAFFPVYGLAENTVALATPPLQREPRIDCIALEAFEKDHCAVPAGPEQPHREFFSEGFPIPEHAVRIVDKDQHVLAERCVGQVQFQGPSAMQGYYHNPEATQRIYHQGWWETGDLGYIADGELFITGRKKDIIIKAGRNIYPEIIEDIAGNVPGVRKGCVIAFGVTDPKIGTEKIILVAETKLVEKSAQEKLVATLIEQVGTEMGIPPDQIVLLPPNKIPKTSSGKLQRSTCKQAYLSGELVKKSKAVPWQLTTLVLMAGMKRVRHFFQKMARFLYTIYVWIIIGVTILPTWACVLVLPRRAAGRIVKVWARSVFLLIFCPIKVIHRKNLHLKKPVIYAANHASYMDSLLLAAILPPDTLFIAKKELLHVPIIKSAIKKLRYITIDRLEFAQNIEDTRYMQKQIEAGESLLIFPEGTFTYASGLRPFKAGAFQLAVDTNVVICPIAMKNTRKLLRDDSLLFSPQKLIVTVCESLQPQGGDWREISRLRNETRKIIAAHCGEAVVDLIVAGPPR